MQRIVNTLLIIVTFIGAFLAWRASGPYSEARAAYLQFSSTAREFEVQDKTKLNLRYIPSNQPLEFEWYVYIPEGFQLKRIIEFKCGGSGSTSSGNDSMNERYGKIRLRLRKIDGQWHMWKKGPRFSGNTSIGSADFLDDLEQLSISVAAEDGPLLVSDTEAFELLSISPKGQPRSEEAGFIQFDWGHPTALDEMRNQRKSAAP